MSPDLRNRILPAILYVIAIAAALLWNNIGASLLLILFYSLCLYEFLTVRHNRIEPKAVIGITIALILFTTSVVLLSLTTEFLLYAALFISLIGLINVFYLIKEKKSIYASKRIILNAISYISFPFALAIACIQHDADYKIILLGVFIIIWLNDAGAYFVGRAIGKTKLFPSVSPGKTWEGLIGGILLGGIISYAVCCVFGVLTTAQWLIMALIIGITGTYGDLTESSWKRYFKIKDSSKLFPGHGGFLDRLDSFIYTIPFITLAYLIFSAG